jgi:hypothetical protein
MLLPNTSPPAPQARVALTAISLMVASPDFGHPTLKVRKDVRPADALSRPLARLCAHCYGPLRRRSRASQTFCSTACRMAAHRAKAAAGVGFVAPIGSRSRRYATHQKQRLVSIPCKAATGHPYPFAEAPLDILGGGHRWPRIARLDPELRRQIINQEVGA